MKNVVRAPRLIVVLGSTGVGKSKMAIELARRFDGEIISTDSMQLYEGLDIVTNKVTPDEACGIPHHLMSFLQPLTLGYTVIDFRNKALSAIDEIISRNKLPILVGGTNYYVESVLWKTLICNSKFHTDHRSSSNAIDNDASPSTSLTSGLFPFERDIPVELLSKDNDELYAVLSRVDPEMASRIHPKNRRKIIRSLQIYFQEGRKQSELLKEQHASGYGKGAVSGPLRFPRSIALWLQCDLKVLDTRLDQRVNVMAERGLKQEIAGFYDQYFTQYEERLKSKLITSVKENEKIKGVFQCIGFKEFSDYLKLSSEERETEIGRSAFEKGLELLKIATRQYARKQIRWINNRFLGKPLREVPPVFGLNTTDLTQWEHIEHRAFNIVKSFLNDEKISDDRLPIKEIPLDSIRNKIFFCDLCNRHVQGGRAWEMHCKSKSHRHNQRLLQNANDQFGLWS